MDDDKSIRDMLPSGSERESVSDLHAQNDPQALLKTKIYKPSLKSQFSSRKLLMHQNDRYEVKNMEQGMFANTLEEEQGSQMYLQQKQKSKETFISEDLEPPSVIRKSKNIKLAPLKPLKRGSDVKFLGSENFTKRTQDDSLVMSLEKLRLKTKFKADEIENFCEFTKQNIPRNKFFAGTLRRSREGFSRFFPYFDLFFTEELRYIMSSKRKPCFKTSTFHMSSQREDIHETSKQYVGTVNSNFSGSVYNLFDESEDKQILATIIYKSHCICSTLPRQLQVYTVSPYYRYSQLLGVDGKKNLKDLYEIAQNSQNKRIIKLVNKKAKWNQRQNCWTLNFHGKAPQVSVKNLILVDAQTEEKEALLIGKSNNDTYNIDINHPLSLRVAMAIVSSSFDFKWTTQ